MDELYAEHPVFKDSPFLFVICIVLIAAGGLGLLLILVWHLRNKASKLVITEDKILYEVGLLSKSRSELKISNVRSIKVEQSFMNRIFGTGSILIFTAGDSAEITAAGMPDPNKARDIINEYTA